MNLSSRVYKVFDSTGELRHLLCFATVDSHCVNQAKVLCYGTANRHTSISLWA